MRHHPTFERAREQLDDLSGGWQEVGEALAAPAGIPDRDEDDEELPNPEDVRENILGGLALPSPQAGQP